MVEDTAEAKIAGRLMAHSRLCRKLAAASLDEDIGAGLLRMAEECLEASIGAAPLPRPVAIRIAKRNSRFDTTT